MHIDIQKGYPLQIQYFKYFKYMANDTVTFWKQILPETGPEYFLCLSCSHTAYWPVLVTYFCIPLVTIYLLNC